MVLAAALVTYHETETVRRMATVHYYFLPNRDCSLARMQSSLPQPILNTVISSACIILNKNVDMGGEGMGLAGRGEDSKERG